MIDMLILPIIATFALILILALRTKHFIGKPQNTNDTYSSKRLLNVSEGKLYTSLEKWRRANARELNLSAQVCYGAFISADDDEMWRKIAFKQADFIFWGRDGYVKAIIEFDGSGHYGRNSNDAQKAKSRDQIKNAAAMSANIPLIRIPQNASPSDIDKTISDVLLGKRAPLVVQHQSDTVMQ